MNIIYQYVISNLILDLVLNYLSLLFLGKLVKVIYGHEKFVDIVLKIFIFNPYLIYHMGFYCEKVFLLLQILGLYFLLKKIREENHITFFYCLFCNVFFMFSSMVRSNGFLSSVYIIYFYIIYRHEWTILKTIQNGSKGFVILLMGMFPFLIINFLTKKYHCNDNQDNFEFCGKGLKSFYSYIQKNYWGINILVFKDERQPLMGLLLIPILTMFFNLMYSKYKLHKSKFFKKIFNIVLLKKNQDSDDYLLPSYVLFIALLIIGVFMIHFNTITRLISGYPFYYIFIAEGYIYGGKFARFVIRTIGIYALISHSFVIANQVYPI